MLQPLVANRPRISHITRVNLPNAITLSRLILTAIFIAGASLDSAAGNWVAVVSFVIAAISDFSRQRAWQMPCRRDRVPC